ncbi:maltose-binding protein /trehalose-binding protein /sucrose-binding protein [Hasllibacter halocynthiae]|uniref:Maltose-binding protein /trehalose-binding protein /sucrose-binding protein n=1 Tax=Hasllibacter halocynthiae TaxID=595589 RepID=A0A2T0X8N9_9RHOB|nr:ABC transporter substrate-binding protein [Hasllibacter halocynthiae]PRY95275.1 maltose-binding protein /trehalose-binding protein /sucrose-binding protein [Hasllibacter halocynthiae]
MTRLHLAASALALAAGGAFADTHSEMFTPGEGPFSWDSYEAWADGAPDLSGQTLTVFGPWLDPDDDVFRDVLAFFNEATGADAVYTGSDGFEQQIVIDVEAGSPPNVAIFPQPGLAADIAAQGLLSPLGEEAAEWVEENYAAGPSWVALGTYGNAGGEEEFYGFFFNVNVKSLVWYVPENFEDAGYEVPETMEDLIALTEQIAEDGETPWCIGLASGPATGWPATDWVEDMMLRLHAPEVYDQWVAHEIPFDDPQVVEAVEQFGFFAKDDAFVNGGAGAVASTDFRDSPAGLFASPPQCYMHRQASFTPAFFPDGTVVGEDADFFYLPGFADRDLGNPVLGGGTLMAITDPSPAATAFMEFLQLPLAHEVMMAQTGFLTPHLEVNPEAYQDDTLRGQGEILRDATTFRFDGSDLMPGEVGAGTFWTGMVDYVGGASAEDVTGAIEDSWSE